MHSQPAYFTDFGKAFCGDSRTLLDELSDNSIDLVITSPPFALLRKKDYGNMDQQEYIAWFSTFATIVFRKLKPTGSFVIDLGGAYERGIPRRSLYNFRLLIHLCDKVGFSLAEDFYWHNPAKLPSPIEWVNKRKIRVKDSVNTIWWLSKEPFPKADVRNVLTEYSSRMKKLLADPEKFYRPKDRPSGHNIGTGFANDNGGAIPSNLLQISNTESNSSYMRACNLVGERQHPARFPAKVPEFFVKFLTEPDDLVVDIFAGSNTSGAVAESLGRRWFSFEEKRSYVATSAFRFASAEDEKTVRNLYEQIMAGNSVDMQKSVKQNMLFQFV